MGSFRSIESATKGFPQQFGDYELLARLATGGMGEVFLARHREWREGFEKLVVLKRVLPHLMDQERFVRMFQHEARIAARIQHTNVCQTFELGAAEGVYYMTMEYLEGLPFNQVIRQRKQDARLSDLRLMARFVTQAAEGLHAAHTLRDEHGELVHVVHRDVCHSNIFITSVGVAKLLDFGVAKARGAVEKTRTGVVKGTYAYSAPEQLRGEVVDARADVFGLGIVAWEAVTGRRLFRRDTDFLVFKAINEDPIPSALAVRADVPERLSDVIERALCRDREGRFSTARDFGLAVGEAIDAVGPPLSAVAVATLLESAFTEELQAQRRLCGFVDETERETLENMPRADRFSDASVTRPFQADSVARVVGALPLAADTEELPAMFGDGADGAFAELDDAPDFEVTPVEDGITYSAMTPMPHLRKKKPRLGTETVTDPEPTATTRVSTAPARAPVSRSMTDVDDSIDVDVADHTEVGDRAEVADDAEVDPGLYTETVPPLRPARRSSVVPVLAIACALALAGVGYVASRDHQRSGADEHAVEAPRAAATAEAPRVHAVIQRAEVVVPSVADEPDAAVAAVVDAAVAAPDAQVDAGATPTAATDAAPPPEVAGVSEQRRPPRRKRRVERRPAPAAEPGFLTLDAKPYGTVWIDGKKVGVTPLVRVELAAGLHDVRVVSSADGASKRFKVKVLAGKVARKRVAW